MFNSTLGIASLSRLPSCFRKCNISKTSIVFFHVSLTLPTSVSIKNIYLNNIFKNFSPEFCEQFKSGDQFWHALELLRSNQLNRFRDEILCATKSAKTQRTKDNYFWMLIRQYYKRNLNVKDVEKVFLLYLSLYSAHLNDKGECVASVSLTSSRNENDETYQRTLKNESILSDLQQNLAEGNNRIIFSQKTMFNLLNVAYTDYRKTVKKNGKNQLQEEFRLLSNIDVHKKNENRRMLFFEDEDDEIFVDGFEYSQEHKYHIYEIILNAIEKYESSRKRRILHGAVLLAHNHVIDFFEQFKIVDQKVSAEDVDYLCKLAKNVKEPRILLPLIDFEYFLPQNDEIISNVYEILALLYGQRHDTVNLKLVFHRLISAKRRLFAYRHALHRIRHFFRCANVAAPSELLQVIARIDPSMRA